MKHDDELGARIAKVLEEGTGALSPEQRDRLAAARRKALARYQPAPAPVWAPAWATSISGFTEQSVLGVRYLIPFAALILGLLGVVYMHTGTVPSDIADIDAGLLTDELPINAFLDTSLDSWLTRSSR
ncbi:MAG TPA: DUF3619 family protein [Burkholderiales bacterium]|nr:DUF3619 family protein [Burkholderiales bacterium]